MATEVQTQTGRCATHGTVQGTREIPGWGFPFIVYAVLRYRARRRPFLCPECGTAVEAD
ncbi:MAG: hypothetical protein ACLPN6_11400 [Streptosporangiaceae bacterium]|jgi:hypothetical protein